MPTDEPVASPVDTDTDASPTTPDTLDPRPYIEIRPADVGLDTNTVVQAMVQLQSLLADAATSGLRNVLTRSATDPVVEWLLVSDGRDDASLRYLVGVDPIDRLDQLADICRTCFPDSYEFERVGFHPRQVEGYTRGSEAQGDLVPTDSHGTDPNAETATRGVSDGGSRVTAAPPEADVRPSVAGVEYVATTDLGRDWQTPLTPFATVRPDTDSTRNGGAASEPRGPLATLVETMRDADVPIVYQVLCRPHRDWSGDAKTYMQDLEDGLVSVGDKLWHTLTLPDRERIETYDPPEADRTRIESIAERDARRTVSVTARAVALGPSEGDGPSSTAERAADRMAGIFSPVGGRFHDVRGRVRTDDEHGAIDGALDRIPFRDGLPPGQQVYEDLCTRTAHAPSYTSLRSRLPFATPASRGIVVAPEELPAFCVIDGAGLTDGGRRALEARHRERTALALPPPRQLAWYRPPGMPLVRPLDSDRQVRDDPVVLPPPLQLLHILLVGATGAGKSTTLTGSILDNVEATDGPDILVDSKGGGMARDYLRAHYARHGDLEDVLYFDCTEFLPAISFFDLRPLLDAGVPREEARSRVAGHYEEILEGVMGADRYGQAVRSPTVIRNHLRALFDPVHGADAITHRTLHDALRRTQRHGEPPVVTDPELDAHFEALLSEEPRVRSQVLGGATGRVDTIATDGRLSPLFEHVADYEPGSDPPSAFGPDVTADDLPDEFVPHFDCSGLVDEDKTIVLDFGGMDDSVKRTLTLVFLSELWTGLKARAERRDGATGSDHPIVNLYLEEAADVADTELVDTLLSQGRSFGLSVTLGVQYPGQLASADPGRDTYREALNETATFVVGNVGVDDDLARVLATEDMPPDRVARRLGALGRGEWLVRPAAGFDEPTPRPFMGESLPAPTGHPASDEPLQRSVEEGFRAELDRLTERTRALYGLELEGASGGEDDPTATASDVTASESASGSDAATEEATDTPSVVELKSLLPHTRRLPSWVEYFESAHALRCEVCGSRYDPTADGMKRVIGCCHDADAVSRDDLPVCEVNLKLSPEAVADSEWSLKQLLFLQAVYNAQQRRYDPIEYDIVYDSMVRLREYVGIDTDDVVELVEAGLLTEERLPHQLYSVTADGREAIGEAYRQGVDFGDGAGDLDETSQHVMAVEAGKRLLEQEYLNDPDSAVAEVKPYHEIRVDGERRRLDCAGLDSEGDVVVALEAERINHDVSEAVPADFDKMAACDPEAAIWIVLSRSGGHEVIEALADPPDGEPRVEKTYSENTPPWKFTIDTAGLTDIYGVRRVRETLLETDDP
jgi:DNA helicase HerA-like ATPase